MNFEEVVGAYLSARAHTQQKSDRDSYSLKRLQPHFGGRRIRDLKRADVRKYVQHRLDEGVKISTVRRELRLFCAAINFVRLEYELDDMPNPAAKLGLASEEPRVRWLTREEARRLLQEAERSSSRPHLACFIRLALNTGCRRGELLNLEWSRVDFEGRRFLLEARHTKARRRRTVPLNDDAISTLHRLRIWQQRHVPGSPWVFGWRPGGRITTFKTSWTAALKRADIHDFRIHDLRHTFASWLVMQGESLYVVKELLGHASVTQTEVYAHLAPSASAQAVQRLLF
ncbi:tyrosine-type recombinase/integrase [Methyloversatilis thermotolerans]|uniref:tyrosine-type recombinase/integrase n=1 Tax=Methyloversatilis thermotolerans TaxID=1346290 RepID=UPI0003766291|nr:site-specific integrase [Methyloversatilis thermotolerans]